MNLDKEKILKFSFDKSTTKILYYRYKVYFVPIGIILTCLVIFFVIITNQIRDLFSSQAQLSVVRSRVNILQNNLNLLSVIDENKQNNDIQTVTKAMPSQKDYAGILDALATTSRNSSVSISDFSFQVGDLSSNLPSKSPLSIALSLSLKTGIVGTQRFLSELAKTLPISEVSDVEITAGLSTVVISFYYKPFSPIQPDFGSNLPVLSNGDILLLNSLGK